MKYLLTLLFVTNVNAATLIEWIRPVRTGTETFELKDEKSFLKLVKTSNWFKADLEIGEYIIQKTKDTDSSVKELQIIRSRLKAAEQKLNSVGTSYNALNEVTPHMPYFLVDETKIYEGSHQYKELVSLLDKLQEIPSKLENGATLSKDFKMISHTTLGKKTKDEKFRIPFYCDRKNPPTRCLIPNRGVLYLN